ncbi:hypothetical protein TrLO_g11492 [Triparma laevis f. longispina]|uniref:Uncharacterized protein n=1 Tax=Triparma laevis f. longispina TaxID=1714387 RepID=A0A9W7C5M7_9STRA|nr:hypothetical protein TrLO_g11492 [Triparma laevis f. longispina]
MQLDRGHGAIGHSGEAGQAPTKRVARLASPAAKKTSQAVGLGGAVGLAVVNAGSWTVCTYVARTAGIRPRASLATAASAAASRATGGLGEAVVLAGGNGGRRHCDQFSLSFTPLR